MSRKIREMRDEDVQTCATICFNAFGKIAREHNFRLDFPTLESALGLTGSLFNNPQSYSVVAELDGRVIGSNHLWEFNSIRGVGPITVDPDVQSKGTGRSLMQAVIDRGSQADGIRLVQDSFNATSLSLYTSLGFDVKEPLVVIEGKPKSRPSGEFEVRRINPEDYDPCGELYRRLHGFDRINEHKFIAGMLPSFVGVRNSEVVAYATAPGFWPLNHAVAKTEDDMRALLTGAGDLTGEPLSFLLPIRNASHIDGYSTKVFV